MKAAPRYASPPIWGDGFAGDALAQFANVVDGRLCSADELILFYPRLRSSDPSFVDRLRDHLTRMLALRSWRFAQQFGWAALPRLRAISAREICLLGEADDLSFFADRTTLSSRLSGIVGRSTPAGFDTAASLALLDGALHEMSSGAVCALDDDDAVRFAFYAGLNPTYLNPSLICCVERTTLAAWLGVLDRGRAALMPKYVAELVLEATDGRAGVRDPVLASMLTSAADWLTLVRAARSTIAGRESVVKLPRAPRRTHRPAHPPVPVGADVDRPAIGLN